MHRCVHVQYIIDGVVFFPISVIASAARAMSPRTLQIFYVCHQSSHHVKIFEAQKNNTATLTRLYLELAIDSIP